MNEETPTPITMPATTTPPLNPIPPPLPCPSLQDTLPVPPPRKRRGTVVKMLVIATLALLLLVPLTMVKSVLTERQDSRNEAITNITSTWGTEQIIVGPVLIIPYKYPVKTRKERVVDGRMEQMEVCENTIAYAHFLPSDLKISGKLEPSTHHRGIYETVVYRASLDIKGTFARPSFDEWKVKSENIMWEDAIVTVGITDLRGASDTINIKWGNELFAMKPGSKLQNLSSGIHAKLGAKAFNADTIVFELPLVLNGSRSVSFAPVGSQTEALLASTWPDPSFQGAFAPLKTKISADGFEALWQVSCYGRSFDQQWSTQEGATHVDPATLRAAMLGVDLIPAVDAYRYVERSIKYGILFIALIFTAFFLFEVLASIRVHPFQYTIIGFALCLFYLALLSLSEVMSFGMAYLTGAIASALMITLYSMKALRSSWRALAVAGELVAIYGFLYILLRQQDYSLLFGTAGLFIVLAIVMYTTRNIDWYARDEK